MTALDQVVLEFAANSVRASIVIVILLVVRRFLRARIPAAVLHLAWVLVACRLLLPGGIPVEWAPQERLVRGLAEVVPAAANTSMPLSSVSPAALPEMPTPLAPQIPGSMVAPSVPVSGWSLLQLAEAAWIGGVAALVLRRLGAGWVLRRRIRLGEEPSDPRLLAAAGPIPVRTTRAVCVPAVHGLLRPTLLFPPGMASRLSDAELKVIVAHETGHIRRRDLWAALAVDVAAMVHWFNPLAWAAAYACRLDCELACDEHVLRRAGRGHGEFYGATLLKVARLRNRSARVFPALGIFDRKSQLQQRIQMILSHPTPSRFRILGTAFLFLMLAAVCLVQEPAAVAAEANPAADVPPQHFTVQYRFDEARGQFVVAGVQATPAPGTAAAPAPASAAESAANLEARLAAVAAEILGMQAVLAEKLRERDEISQKIAAAKGAGQTGPTWSASPAGTLMMEQKDRPTAYYVINRAVIDRLGVVQPMAGRTATQEAAARQAADEREKAENATRGSNK